MFKASVNQRYTLRCCTCVASKSLYGIGHAELEWSSVHKSMTVLDGVTIRSDGQLLCSGKYMLSIDTKVNKTNWDTKNAKWQ